MADITVSSSVDTFMQSATQAAMRTNLGLGNVDNTSDANKPVSTAQAAADSAVATAAATDATTKANAALAAAIAASQPLDSDLTAIAALTPSNDDVIQRKAGVWTNRTMAQVKTDLALTKSDVGLSNVPNTDATNASNISSGTLAAARGGAGTVNGLLKADGAGTVSAAASGTDYEPARSTVSQAEAEAGTATTVRGWTAERVKQAIVALAPGGSGSVATDAIFDAKGDLPVGTGANTAAKLTVGTDGYVLTADSTQSTGLKWAAASGSGTKTYAVIQPWEFLPDATNGPARDTRNQHRVLNFDDTTEEACYADLVMPEAASLGSGLKIRIPWISAATSGAVRWGVAIERMNTDLDSDSFDTVAEAHSTTNATAGIETVTEITITTIDSVAAGERYRLKIYRDVSDTTNDTMTGDAQLLPVEVRSAA